MRTAVAQAALAIAAGGLAATPAQALTLGGMTVLSSLGEALRAEVQVFDLTPTESASLIVQPASAAAFRAAGVDFNAALTGMQVAVDRRADGQVVIRIAGNRAVNEPFLELLLEATWNGGQLARNYTVLLDPPAANRRAAPAAPLAPQVAAQAIPAAPSQPSAPPVVTVPRRAPVPTAPPAAPAPRAAAPTPRPPVAATAGGQVTVRAGDTASRIANSRRTNGVSLDQMLVAMLQANPDAFVDGNVNRIRAGAVIDMPAAADAAAVPAAEAHQTVIAQSRDFNEFRRRLAAGAPAVASAAPQRQASGSVQAQVEDRRPTATTPDRLTLTKPTVNAAAAAEAERIARARQERESAQRVAELSRNVDELNRLGTAAGSNATTAPPPAPAPAPAAPAAPADAIAPLPATAPAAPSAASPAVDAASPAPAASTTQATPPAAPAPVVTPPAPTPPPVAAPSLLDSSPLGDPKILGIVGLLVALIVALVSYRSLRRRRALAAGSLLGGANGPDSFFGASGGGQIDTRDGGPSTLATSYSPSQLDAGGEVDPIAEADVYLAYGRELQAEEILKEALRSHPERTALHAKLGEIYAKRRDVAAFTALATEAHRLTDGKGADWERLRSLGAELDPTHPLFSATGDTTGAATAAGLGAVAAAGLAAGTASTPASQAPAAAPAPAEPLELEPEPEIALDFEQPQEAEPPAPATAPEPVEPEMLPSLDLDFGAFTPDAAAPPTPAAPPPSAAPAAGDDDIDFGLDFDLDAFDSPAADSASPQRDPPPAMDLSAFSLDLDDAPAAEPEPTEPPPAPAPTAAISDEPELPEVGADDALATKLALADEFNAIGDVDGARHLIEEVIAESSGSVRERAERMLSALP